MGLEEPYRWKDSVQSEPEIRLWVAEGTANGMRPWVTKFSGVLYDRRWLPVVERIYQWHFDHERYLRNEAPMARVAVLHSEQTEDYHPGVAPGDRGEDHVLGMYHALIEARVPFELRVLSIAVLSVTVRIMRPPARSASVRWWAATESARHQHRTAEDGDREDQRQRRVNQSLVRCATSASGTKCSATIGTAAIRLPSANTSR